MHDIVKDEDLSALAAEYVIGTLDPDERTRANVLLEVDEGFRALVRAWERRLGELHLMVEPVEPNSRIWERVRGRLGIRAAEAPPPFAPTPPPFVPPVAEPVRAAAAEPRFEPKFEPSFESMVESKFESKFELPRAPQLEPAHEASTPEASTPETPAPETPTPAEPTREQRLAALIREADKFSESRTADTTTTASTIESAAIVAEPEVDAAADSQADAVPISQVDATTEAEALLEEAADAIAAKSIESVEPPESVEPAETGQVGKVAPAPDVTKVEPWPTGAPRRDTMLTPADLARLTFRTQERRLETWRAAMLFMSVVALGLGSLIAAWRFVPERLPMRLQPTAVLGLPDLGPSERIPAQHGTQFEE
jgi:hypothetical protein